MTGSITVPIFGQILSCFGEKHFELFCALSMSLIALAHVVFFYFNYLAIPTATPNAKLLTHEQQGWVFIPVLIIGFGHALQAALTGPLVNKIVPDKKLQPTVLSTMKIFEGCTIAFFTYVNGHIRQLTGKYDEVNCLIIFNCMLGLACAL